MITLATLPQATAQQVFDQVARHLLMQNERAWSAETENCAYRDDKGLKCAAGCLMSDDEHDTLRYDIEGLPWWDVVYSGYASANCVELIEHLQNVHDVTPVACWSDVLEGVAVKYQLNVDVLKEFE